MYGSAVSRDADHLIHTNGRLFDPTLGIFLQADPLIQTESDIFEITLPDGRIIVRDEEGAIEVLDEIEPVRAERWRARLS